MPAERVIPVEVVAAAGPVLGQALAYDELPDGSDLRREYGADGAITIFAPAGEPSAAARRAAAQGTGVASAALCGAVMVALLWIARTSTPVARLDVRALSLVAILFGVVWGGVFLLAWKVRLGARMDVLTRARRESVVIHVTPWRLIVEKAGPGGERSFDWPAGRVRGLSVVGEPLCADGAGAAESVPCLRVTLDDGASVALMHGRHEGELRWVATTVGQCLNLPVADQAGRRTSRLRTIWRLGLW